MQYLKKTHLYLYINIMYISIRLLVFLNVIELLFPSITVILTYFLSVTKVLIPIYALLCALCPMVSLHLAADEKHLTNRSSFKTKKSKFVNHLNRNLICNFHFLQTHVGLDCKTLFLLRQQKRYVTQS